MECTVFRVYNIKKDIKEKKYEFAIWSKLKIDVPWDVTVCGLIEV